VAQQGTEQSRVLEGGSTRGQQLAEGGGLYQEEALGSRSAQNENTLNKKELGKGKS
jgi:hypothetical protein